MEDFKDTSKIMNSATRWLYDMELVDNPMVLNNLYINIFSRSRSIKDVELLIDSRNKKILVYIKLAWYSRLFKKSKRKIAMYVIENLQELLPRYEIKVTTKIEIFNKIRHEVYNILNGGINENNTSNISNEPHNSTPKG